MEGIIYETQNIANGMIYRGQHICGAHCNRAYPQCNYLGSGDRLVRAVQKHGRASFTRRTLAVCHSQAELNEAEADYITIEFAEREDTYNLCEGGGGQGRPSSATRAKMSKARKGKAVSAETRARQSAAKQNLSQETRRRMSEALKRRLTPKLRATIAESNRRRVYTPEMRAEMSRRSTGRKHTAETRAKIGAAHKGTKRSAAARRKMSIAAKNRQQRTG